MRREVVRHSEQIEVTFTDLDRLQISAAAEAREQPKTDNPLVRDQRIGTHDNVETHAIGIMGEIAVGRVLGLNPDLAAYVAGDKSGDFLFHGAMVEVKTMQGYLALAPWQMHGAAAYVLVVYTPKCWDAVAVQGWTTEAVFGRRSFDEDFGHGPCRAMQPCDLYPMGTLTRWCQDVSDSRQQAARS